MSYFKESAGEGENLFKNEDALDPEFVPKLLPYRDFQQKRIAACIKPLLEKRDGRNAFVYGAPGIGKTAALKWVLRELEEEYEDVLQIYINCWQKNTTYKILLDICEQLGYAFTQNKNSEQLFEVIKGILNKKQSVLVFDEIDRAEDQAFLYSILNEIYKTSIIMITNVPEWIETIDHRIQSRILAERIEFKKYSQQEIKEILQQRTEYAFLPETWQHEALEEASKIAYEQGDIRTGMFIMREAGRYAEEDGQQKITPEHITKAKALLSKKNFDNGLNIEEKEILSAVKEDVSIKIGDLHKKLGEKINYKTLQRRIEKLSRGGYIRTETIKGGQEGSTTLINYEKKLSEF